MNTAGLPPEHLPPHDTPPPFWLRWRWIHWIARKWWGLFAFLGTIVLGNALALLLSRGVDHWWDGVQEQFSALLNLISSNPLPAEVIIGSVFFLTGVAFLGNLLLNHQEQARKEERQRVLMQQIAAQQVQNPAPSTASSTNPSTPSSGVEVILPEKENPSLANLPDTPAPIWHVPYQRNDYFTGRESIFQQLHASLSAHKIAILSQGISDLGGIGKTQTAVEYAHRFSKEYQAVLWVQAETQQLLIDSFASIARLLNLPEWKATDQSQTIAAVKHWLGTHTGWLLIADNVEDWASLQKFLPAAGSGHQLLITHAPVAEIQIQPAMLEPLTPKEGAEFLVRRGGFLASATTDPAGPTPPNEQAQTLSKALGGFPLALEHAGAYIKEAHGSFASYQEDYNKDYQAKKEQEIHRGRLLSGYTRVAATTWALAFKYIKENSTATELLLACAFLYPEAIPEKLFHDGAPALNAQLRRAIADPLEWYKAIELLSKFSLLWYDSRAKTFWIHRTLQAVLVRTEVGRRDTQQRWARQTVQMMNQAFPKVEPGTWEVCQQYLSQALTCAKLIKQWQFTFPEAIHLLERVGQYCYERNQYNLAEPLLTQARSIREQQVGKSHPDLVSILSILANTYQAQGKFEEALPLLQQISDIQERQLGPQHPDLALTLIKLAKVYMTQEQPEKVLPLLERALAIQRQLAGPEHTNASTLIDLATIYQTQGKLQEALPLLEQALRTREKHLGKIHPDLVPILSPLIMIYHAFGQDEQELLLLEQKRAIYEQQFGKTHPDLVPILTNLATIYHARSRDDQELSLLHQILQIQEQQLGPDHPDLAPYLINLGERYCSLSQYKAALPLLQRALTIRERQLGKTHPDLVSILINLATIYRTLGPHEEALPLLQRALEIQKQQLGANHLELIPLLKDLSELYQEQGQQEAAATCLQEALRIREQELGENHLDVASSLRDLGTLYRVQGLYEEAMPLLQRALAIRQQQLGRTHPSVASSLDDLATLHSVWAGTLYAQAQNIRANQQPST